MTKTKRPRRHGAEFKGAAVEKMKGCDNIVALARELKVHWRLLYRWKAAAESAATTRVQEQGVKREAELQAEIARLKTALADKTLELDFFRGALQKIEALRHKRVGTGEGAFTTKSGK